MPRNTTEEEKQEAATIFVAPTAKSKKPTLIFFMVHVYLIRLYFQQLSQYKRHHGLLHKIMHLVLDVCSGILIEKPKIKALVFIQV